MVKEKKYIITRSNYTLKKKHKQLGSDSTIYERDFMITNNGQTWSGDGSSYGTSSFKMVSNTKNGGSYKYNTGEWLKNPVCTDDLHDKGEIWTLNCIPDTEKENSESKIHINPNTSTLLSFAYYSSTKDLIKNAINNIIEKFPAEIVLTGIKANEKGYVVENDFFIDLQTITTNKNYEEDLRLFTQNYEKYVLIKEGNSFTINGCEVTNSNNIKCAKEGDLLFSTEITFDAVSPITIKCYYEKRKKVYYTNTSNNMSIRPKEDYINIFFDNLNLFEKNMLNKNTTPLYKMILDFPHETENGVETYKKSFIWPTKKSYNDNTSWNLDINSYEYEKYLTELLTLCDFYDERCTNNLWRSLTHDSIKNMDYAFKNEKTEDDEYSLGEGRFEEIVKCFAKQFDEIKQYIDNIKTNNTITYVNENNIPSYFLSDKLENSGWEVYNLANVLNKLKNESGENVKDINIDKDENYNVSDININMMKHLQINSKQILARKGTRHGINMLLGLFGLKSYDVDKNLYDYKITEYVDVVKNDENVDYDTVISFNAKKKNFIETYSDFEGNTTDPLQGLPVKAVSYVDDEGNDKFYLIPWFDKEQVLDGNIYYQMYGGWGKSFTKELSVTDNINDDIIGTENIPIYSETIKNLIAVQNIDDLKYISYDKKHQNCVAYVYNIEDFDDVYKNDDITNITLSGDEGSEKATNYFILHTLSNSYTIGSYKTGDNINYGWVNITEKDIENNTDNGIRVKLLESVVENHKGNNPHGGVIKYDDGETYIDYFKKIFKHSLENENFNDSMYTCEDGLLNPEIEKIGFDIERQQDDVKIWYFTNTNNNEENKKLLELTLSEDDVNSYDVIYKGVKYKNIKSINYSYKKNEQKEVKIGLDNDYTFFESKVSTFNFEGGKKYDEVAANSIINNKKMLIEFSNGLMDNSIFPRFLQECILPYLTQIIPSTTIWEVRLEGGNAIYTENDIEVGTVD